tara:strand:+ start:3655 stop:3864 length:210 start_codon:yes stop_codon:yes gene_type:complete
MTPTPPTTSHVSVGSALALSRGNNMAGLYDNIHAKRKRIKAGSNEKMKKVGAKGAPTAKAFKKAAKSKK